MLLTLKYIQDILYGTGNITHKVQTHSIFQYQP